MAKDQVHARVTRIVSELFGVRNVNDEARLRSFGVETIKETSMLADQLNHELKTHVSSDDIRGNMKVSQLVDLVRVNLENSQTA